MLSNKQIIISCSIIFILFSLSELLASDFQYEYNPFPQDQVYTINISDEDGLMREFYVIGTLTYRYTTKSGNFLLKPSDFDQLNNLLNELGADATNNHHIIQSEPINPIQLQMENLILPPIANFYRHIASCNVLKLKSEANKAAKRSSSWKQRLIKWIEGL